MVTTRFQDDDPWTRYAELRGTGPVHRDPDTGEFVVVGHPEAVAAFTAPELVSGHPFRASRRLFGPTVIDLDGPVHARIRGAFSVAFRRSRLRAYEAEIVEPAVLALTSATSGEVDAVAAIARPLPMLVMAGLLALPVADVDWLCNTAEPIGEFLDYGGIDLADARVNLRQLTAYVRERINRRELGGPLGSELLAGIAQHRLSADEVVANVVLLLVGGVATTANAIANVLGVVSQNRDLAARLRRGQVDSIEVTREALRLQPPVRFTPRVTQRAVRLANVEIPAHAVVQLCLPSANRDPRVFGDPDEFRLDRANGATLTFGRGLHACIGGALGEMEAAAAARALSATGPLDLVVPVRLARGRNFRRAAAVLVRPARGLARRGQSAADA